MKRRFLFALLPLALAGCGYNKIQQYDEQVNNTQHQIEVYLQRRADLIPNLVETVKGYAQHEQEVFTRVAEARAGLAGAIGTHDPAQMAAANTQLTGALGRLLAISEAYPQLKADQGFLRLQDELSGTENRIATARNDYNQSVQTYNSYIRTFPQALTAKVTGAKARTYFEAAAGTQAPPKVDFGTSAPKATTPATVPPAPKP